MMHVVAHLLLAETNLYAPCSAKDCTIFDLYDYVSMFANTVLLAFLRRVC